MAGITAKCEVIVRDDLGRFLSRYENAKRTAIQETVIEGAELARAFAPSRTGEMASTIKWTVGTSGGTWSVGTNHWKYAEGGAAPHEITGWVTFFWEREGRMWHRGRNMIRHPGMQGKHFMQRSYAIAAPKLVDRIKRNM